MMSEGKQMHTAPLPDWSDLPAGLRAKLDDEGRYWCEPGLGGDAALHIYNVIRDNLPPQTFPLFTRTAEPVASPTFPALVEALKDVTASLVAAHSLLSRGSKRAAPSDKMFDQMLADYEKSIAVGRAALAAASTDQTGGSNA